MFLCFLTLCISYNVLNAADRGSISGHVRWDGGFGSISDAAIYIYDFEGNAVDSTFTNGNGYFTLSLPAGSYIVSADKGNLVKEYYLSEYCFKDADRVVVHGGQNIALDFDLDSGGWITGNFDYIGEDVEFGLLTALKVDEPHEGWSGSVRLNGPFPSAYAISGLLPGTYKVLGRARGKSTEYFPGVDEIERAATIVVARDVGVSDVDFMLDQVGWGSIQGRVFDNSNGQGLADLSLYAYQWQDFWNDPNLFTGRSLNDGSYAIDVPAGQYSLFVLYDDDMHGGTVAQYFDDHYSRLYADILEVAENNVVQDIDFAVDFSVPHNLTIAGTVLSEWTGMGLNDVNVEAIDYETGETVGSAFSVSNGEFCIGGLSPGNYLLMFSGTYIIPFFYPQEESWQDGEIIRLQGHFTGVRSEAITQDYGNMGLLISGGVTDEGNPVNGARIYAYLTGDSEPIAYARTNSSGEYAIVAGLVPGTYSVMCDYYGFSSEIFPVPIELDLLQQPHADNIDFELHQAVGISDKPQLPNYGIDIIGNYPNPFNSRTTISLNSGYDTDIESRLVVHNLLGQVVGEKGILVKPGRNLIEWDLNDFATAISSGVYFYRVDGISEESRMILLK